MKEFVEIKEVLNHQEKWQILDVRSPGEFSDGHIPGAVNFPLFSDDERARVGTLYKQVSREAAMDEGLSIAGAKMPALVSQGRRQANHTDKKILIHCWRGGNRSKAVEWLLRFSGLEVYRLHGGYKSFRQALHQYFNEADFELRILGGCTGAGKTEVLQRLGQQGEQVIDLEKLAHHKGSAFGAIGEGEQPTNEQFENELFLRFMDLNPLQPIWIENESKNIGRIYLPEGLWNKMRDSTLYAIDVDREIRLDRALQYYSAVEDPEILKSCFERIQKRLGGLNYKEAIKALNEHDLRTAAGIALHYYDKAYRFQLANWPASKVIHLKECNDPLDIAEQLILISQKGRPIQMRSD